MNFIIGILVDIFIILGSFFIFSFAINGSKRHEIWEKYIASFGMFVIYIFIISLVINAITIVLVYKFHYEKYLSLIALFVQSIIISFVAACVPRRGIEEGDEGARE